LVLAEVRYRERRWNADLAACRLALARPGAGPRGFARSHRADPGHRPAPAHYRGKVAHQIPRADRNGDVLGNEHLVAAPAPGLAPHGHRGAFTVRALRLEPWSGTAIVSSRPGGGLSRSTRSSRRRRPLACLLLPPAMLRRM